MPKSTKCCCAYPGCPREAKPHEADQRPKCDEHFKLTRIKKASGSKKGKATKISMDMWFKKRRAALLKKKQDHPPVAEYLGKMVLQDRLTGKVIGQSLYYGKPVLDVSFEDGSLKRLKPVAAKDGVNRYKVLLAKFKAADEASAEILAEATASMPAAEVVEHVERFGAICVKELSFHTSSAMDASKPTPRHLIFGLKNPTRMFCALNNYLAAVREAAA